MSKVAFVLSKTTRTWSLNLMYGNIEHRSRRTLVRSHELPTVPKDAKRLIIVCFYVLMPVVSTKGGARAAEAILNNAVLHRSRPTSE